MLTVAAASARRRALSLLVAAALALLGCGLLAALGSLLETGLRQHDSDRGVLVLLPVILGGWSLVIVAYGIAATVSLAIGVRRQELALLRSLGATPRQVFISTVVETLLVAIPPVLVGLLVGRLGAGVLLDGLRRAGMVRTVDQISFGPTSVLIGVGATLLATSLGAVLAGRRAAAVPIVAAMAGADAGDGPDGGGRSRLSRPRRWVAVGLLVVGVAMSGATLAMPNGPLLSSTAGPAGVAVAVGMALAAPAVLAPLGRVVAWLPGATWMLVGRALRLRSMSTGSAYGPSVLLVGIGAGTLCIQHVEDTLGGSTGRGPDLAPVNYTVVGILVAFCCIATVNALLTATRRRSAEARLLGRLGATRAQVVRVSIVESVLAGGVAVALGAVAAAATAVPFSMVRTGSPAPAGWWWLVVMAAVALGLAAAVTVPVVRRAAR